MTDLSITKTDNQTTVYNDTDTTYTIVVTNAGPNAADGAIFKDPTVTGLKKSTVTCSATGGAVCPTITNITTANIETELTNGLAIPTLPSGGSVTFTIKARVTATSGDVVNTATITAPTGITESTPANNTASDTTAVTNLSTFMCQPNIYMTQGNNTATALYELNISGSNQVTRSAAIGGSYTAVNALGFNPIDGYLYAIRYPDHHLIRIGANGTEIDLGDVGLPNNVRQYVGGGFDDAGRYYVIANGSSREIQVINVKERTSTGTGATTPNNAEIHGDIVIGDDFAYGISHKNNGSVKSTPVKIPLSGGSGATFGPSTGKAFGAGYIDQYNDMYFSDNDTNDIYRLNKNTGAMTRIAVAVPPDIVSQNDGAFCRNAIFPIKPTDYGDAPSSYGAPTHTIAGDIRLGSTNTAETDPYNSATASGDTGDDGVTLPSFVAGQVAQITVAVSGTSGKLQAWIDWNRNGTFDSNEQIATNLSDNGALDSDKSSGTITFNVDIPATATAGTSFARFRWSTVSNVTATADLVANGEVEDYLITVGNRRVISGTVFEDNSGTTSTASNAYNAVQDAGEAGIANSAVQLTNCSGTVIAETKTDAMGLYQFAVSESALPTPNFCVVQSNVDGYTSVSGTTGYTRSTDTITVATSTGSYTGLNFGDAKLNLVLTESGQHTVVAGAVTDYPHRLQTDATVQVTGITQTLNQQPSSASDQDWQALVYRDSNCNGTVDAGEALFNPSTSAPVSLLPSADICLVQRVHVPTIIYAGAQHNAQLDASYSVALSNPAQAVTGTSNQVQDTTLLGSAGLELSKKVRKVASCPSTAADTAVFSTVNEATTLDKLEYEITYKNNSVKNLQNVKVKDSVPTGTTFGSISCQSTPSGNSCTPTRTGEALLWQLTGNLTPASSGAVRFCVTPQ